MARNLPPLPALRLFEAAARFLSFKKAADYTRVTPSAVSHAINSLEEHLGVKLFHRTQNKRKSENALSLTDAGKALLPCVTRSFDEIEETVAAIVAQGASDILTVATAPIFARSWLMPRLSRFVDAYPDVNIRINSTLSPAESMMGEFDVGLMYGRGNWPQLHSLMLFPEDMVPVCSPALLENGPPLNTPQDLLAHTLIHSEARLVSWMEWMENAGVRHFNPRKGLHFNRAALAIDAALNGLGVALEGRSAVQMELAQGDLVIPFPAPNMPDRKDGYYLTYPLGQEDIPKVALFRDWVLTEVSGKNSDNP